MHLPHRTTGNVTRNYPRIRNMHLTNLTMSNSATYDSIVADMATLYTARRQSKLPY